MASGQEAPVFQSSLRFLQCYALHSLGLPQSVTKACLRPHLKIRKSWHERELYYAGWTVGATHNIDRVFIHPHHKYQLEYSKFDYLRIRLPDSTIYAEFRRMELQDGWWRTFSMRPCEWVTLTEEEYFEGVFAAIDNNNLLSISRLQSLNENLVVDEEPFDDTKLLTEFLKQCQ